MAYKLMKRIITRGGYDRDEVMNKLDAFLAADRITAEQYKELMAMMDKLAKRLTASPFSLPKGSTDTTLCDWRKTQ